MSANNWISAQVRRPLLNEVREFLKTDSAKRAGLTNSTQFIDVALKDLLERLKPESMMVGGMHDDRIELKDWDAEKQMVQLSVYFDRDGGPFCTYCKESVCIHVQYAWEVPEARAVLETHGSRPPPSRQRMPPGTDSAREQA